jgi:hypothetical protein
LFDNLKFSILKQNHTLFWQKNLKKNWEEVKMIWKNISIWYFEPNKIQLRVIELEMMILGKQQCFYFIINMKRPILELSKLFANLNLNWLNLNFGNNAQFLKAEQNFKNLKTKQLNQNSWNVYCINKYKLIALYYKYIRWMISFKPFWYLNNVFYLKIILLLYENFCNCIFYFDDFANDQ